MAKRKKNPSHLPYLTELVESGYGTFEDFAKHYPQSAAGEMDMEFDTPYYGRNVIWLGSECRMIRVDPSYLTHIEGNIFDADKLAAIVVGIEEASDRIVFIAPYGTVNYIEPQDVKESIEYAEDEGLDTPLTTGDEELDKWLVDPQGFMDAELFPHDSHGHYRTPTKREEERFQAGMRRRLREAVRNNEGDLGGFTCTIRDGNHRAFGALLAGEPFVWMIVEDNQMQDLREKGKKSKGDRAILDALE